LQEQLQALQAQAGQQPAPPKREPRRQPKREPLPALLTRGAIMAAPGRGKRQGLTPSLVTPSLGAKGKA